jgi:transposase
MGCPTKLTPTLQAAITQAVSLGVPPVSAGLYAGVSKACLLQWLQRGQGSHPSRPATKAYVDFVDAIERARAQDEVRRLARLEQAARGGQVTYEKTTTYPDGRVTREVRLSEAQWTADAWFLERSYPDRWGRKERLDMRLMIESAAAKVAAEFGLTVEEVLTEARQLLQEVDRDRDPQ